MSNLVQLLSIMGVAALLIGLAAMAIAAFLMSTDEESHEQDR